MFTAPLTYKGLRTSLVFFFCVCAPAFAVDGVPELNTDLDAQAVRVNEMREDQNQREKDNPGSVDEEEKTELAILEEDLAAQRVSQAQINARQNGEATTGTATNLGERPNQLNTLDMQANERVANDMAAVDRGAASAGPELARDMALRDDPTGPLPEGWTRNTSGEGPQFQFNDGTGSGNTFGSNTPNTYDSFADHVNSGGEVVGGHRTGMELLGAQDGQGNWHSYQGTSVNGPTGANQPGGVTHTFAGGSESGQGVAWNSTAGGNANGTYASAGFDFSNGGPNGNLSNASSVYNNNSFWTGSATDNHAQWVNTGSGPTQPTTTGSFHMTGGQATATPFTTQATAVSQAQINFGTNWQATHMVAQANGGHWFIVPRGVTGNQVVNLAHVNVTEQPSP